MDAKHTDILSQRQRNAQLLGSRLKQWNLFEKGVTV